APPNEITALVQRHRPQPGAKTPLRVVAELRQFLEQDDEHFLDEVGGVLVLQPPALRPAIEHGSVQLHEAVPGQLFTRLPQPPKQARRGWMHASYSGSAAGAAQEGNLWRHGCEAGNRVRRVEGRLGDTLARQWRNGLCGQELILCKVLCK